MSLVTPPGSGSRTLALTTAHLSRAAYKRLADLQDDYARSSKRSKSSSSKKTQTMGRTGQARGGSGFFKGGFAQPVRVTPTIKDIVLTKGSAGTIETHGRCEGTDIVWVGATTCNIPEFAFHVAKALCRKILKQAGVHISNADAPFLNEITYPAGTLTSYGYTLRMQYEDGAGNMNEVTYPATDPETLNTMANNSGLKQAIINYANAASDRICVSMKLYQTDNGSITTGKLAATLNLKNEMVHFFSTVKLVVQNRTKGAVAGSTTSLDVIDAQPLKGKMYYFKKANPDLKQMNNTTAIPNLVSLFSRWSADTIKLISGNETGYDPQLQEPPSPSFWSNCSKSSSVTLEPGDLKDVYISNSIDKYFPDFVRKLAWYNGVGNRRQKVGDCVLIALEERLNSGSTNPIIVQYEAQADFSCYVTTNKIDPIMKTYASSEINKAL